MRLIGHGIVFGLGYLYGRPEGRRQVQELRRRMVGRSRRPRSGHAQDRQRDNAAAMRAALAGIRPSTPTNSVEEPR